MAGKKKSKALNAVECIDCKTVFFAVSKSKKRCDDCRKKRKAEAAKEWAKNNHEAIIAAKRRRYREHGTSLRVQQEKQTVEKPKHAPKVTLEQAVWICEEHGVSYGKAMQLGLFK